jgi:hypothetical protein
MALPVTMTTKCWAHCLPFNFSFCISGTILWEPPYLSQGFACHLHNEILGPLSAFQCPSLHSRPGTMRVTVPEPWLCLSPSRQIAGPIVCLSISLHSGHDTMGGTTLELSIGLPPSRQNARPIVCLPMSFFALQARYYGSHRI